MKYFFISVMTFLAISCKNDVAKENIDQDVETETAEESLIFPEETHFKSLRQVTFGGDNAEAYWSPDGSKLIFQSNNADWGVACDQMFIMNEIGRASCRERV